MQLSRDEYLRISQLRSDSATSVATLGRITTAPAFRPASNDETLDEAEARRLAARMEEEDEMDAAREQVVASLRARVESGTYNVSGEQIAEMMVRRLLADRVR